MKSFFVKYSRKLRDLLLYGGLEKEQFQEVNAKARPENQIILHYSTIIALIAFIILAITASGTAAANRLYYVIFAVLMAGLFAVERYVKLTGKPWLSPLIYIFKYIAYAFGILVSLLHPEFPAVSIIVFLVILPLVFINRPVYLILDTAIVAAVYCILAALFKPSEIAMDDIWNTISFSILGLLANTLMMRIKYRSLFRENRILYMSETDMLTGVQNRNAYEKNILLYPEQCKECLLCIYADVNGLHELNNTSGHEAGDRMLEFISNEMIKRYGTDNTYRTGGDEFVIFKPDSHLEDALNSIEEMNRCFEEKGYHVSFGAACQSIEELEIRSLIKQAENEMYLAKREFYSTTVHDRRRHRMPIDSARL